MMRLTFDLGDVTETTVLNIGYGGAVYNAQLVNGASISTTDYKIGTASLQLVGVSSQYVQIPSFATGSSGLTFACWFRSNGNPLHTRLFDFGNGVASGNILVGLNGGLVLYVFFGTTSYDTTGWDTPITTNVDDNVWRHFAWTLTPSGTWTVYINGVNVWSRTGRYYPAAITRTRNYLGKGNWPGDPYYTGAIEDFRIYRWALDNTLVMDLTRSYITMAPSVAPPSSKIIF
jgi:hypothetical protein